MNQKKDDKVLGELISRAIGGENVKFDFDKWQAENQKEIQKFQAEAKRREAEETAFGKVLESNGNGKKPGGKNGFCDNHHN